jgi:hypothetical protein
MVNLSQAISIRLDELGWTRGRLAEEWADLIGDEGSYDEASDCLDALLDDREDSGRFGFVLHGEDAPRRRAMLAACLGWGATDLPRSRFEEVQRRFNLILHPDLPADQRAFLNKLAESDPDRLRLGIGGTDGYDVTQPTPAELAKLALDLAKWAKGAAEAPAFNFVWLRGNVAMALCCSSEHYGRWKLAQHMAVRDVTTFEPLVAALRRIRESLNPRGDGGVLDLSAEVGAFAEETGIVLTFTIAAVRHTLVSYNASEPRQGERVQRGPELDARVHAVLDDILGREIILPADRASVVWTLEMVRRAPLLHLRTEESRMSLVANIGAGNVMHVYISRYGAERPGPVRLIDVDPPREFQLDAGDVSLICERHLDESLAASVLPAVVRRRQADAAELAARDDDDDDDSDDGGAGWPSTTGNPSGGGRRNA